MKRLFEYAALLVVAYVASTGLGWLLADAVHQFAVVVSRVMSNA